MTEPAPDRVSPTSLPPLTKDELESRITKRKKEMESQPCYRCGHTSAEQNCACCFWAHTPLEDGSFKEAA